jgi:hypothetical protein
MQGRRKHHHRRPVWIRGPGSGPPLDLRSLRLLGGHPHWTAHLRGSLTRRTTRCSRGMSTEPLMGRLCRLFSGQTKTSWRFSSLEWVLSFQVRRDHARAHTHTHTHTQLVAGLYSHMLRLGTCCRSHTAREDQRFGHSWQSPRLVSPAHVEQDNDRQGSLCVHWWSARRGTPGVSRFTLGLNCSLLIRPNPPNPPFTI